MSEERIHSDEPGDANVAETDTRDVDRDRLCRLLTDASTLAEEQGLDLVRYLVHMALLEAMDKKTAATPPRSTG